MSENYNDQFGNAADDEVRRRAERIKAIKQAMRSAAENDAAPAVTAPAEEYVPQPDTDCGNYEPETSYGYEAAPEQDTSYGYETPAGDSFPEPEMPAEPEIPADNGWDSELSERISRISSAKKKKTMTAESLLKELEEGVSPEPERPVRPVRIHSHAASVPVYDQPEAVHAERELPPEQTAIPAAEVPAAAEEAPLTGKKPKKKKKKKQKKTFKQRLLGFFPQKGDSILERVRKLVFLGAIVVIIVCGYIVGDYYIDLWRSKRENAKTMDTYWDEMKEPTTASDDPDDRKKYHLLSGAEYLLGKNKDVVGIIRIEGTKVNNPVMQAEDNKKYLRHKLNGRESRAGELFMDYRNHFDDVDEDGYLRYPNSDNLVIYGHEMADEQMFGSLKYYRNNYDYYGQHPIIQLNSNYEQYQYKIFAFFVLDAEDETETKFDCWNKLDFDDEEDFYDFVNEVKRRNIRLNDVDVKYGDKLLTLSTCNGIFGDRGRLIVMARLVRDGEDPLEGTQHNWLNENVKYPTIYYNTRTDEKYDPDAEFIPYGPEGAKKKDSKEKQDK